LRQPLSQHRPNYRDIAAIDSLIVGGALRV